MSVDNAAGGVKSAARAPIFGPWPNPPRRPPLAAPASRPVKKGDHVFLVDGSGYIFRAYHALPPLNRKSDGLQVNAVLGFCNMLWKLLRDMKPEDKPTHLAVIFDKSEHTFRNELYKDYKAHRPDAPGDLIPQFPLIREAVRAFDIPCLEMLGFEADDLIATYARQACEVGANVTIVSSDKDLMQLVNDCVIMYDTMKDRKIGVAEVIEKFGVPPEKVIEVQSLIGDSTDNVPGVPGIGVKTAAQLIGEFGDLETLLARAGEIKQEKRRQSLIEHAEKARISKVLVTLDQNVKLEVPLADLAVHEPDYKLLIAFLKQMEFSGLTRRVAEFGNLDAGAIDPSSVAAGGQRSSATAPSPSISPGLPLSGGAMAVKPRPGATEPAVAATPQQRAAARLEAARTSKIERVAYEIIRDTDRLEAWIARAYDEGIVALNIETIGIDPMQAPLCGIALAVAPNEACYIPLAHRKAGDGDGLFGGGLHPEQISEKAALAALKPLLQERGVLKIGLNLKYELQVFAVRGIEMQSHEDIMLMSYVLDAGRFGHSLDALGPRYFNHAVVDYNDVIGSGKAKVAFDNVAFEKAAPYVAEDADIALRLSEVLKARMIAEHVMSVYETLERPLLPVLARMERRGISVDRQVLSRLSGEFAQRGAALETEVRTLAGDPNFNPGSPKQLGDILFGKMRLPGGTKTKSGQWSTGARVLDELAEQGHRIAAEDPAMAAGHQAQVDLHRRAAGLHQSDHEPRAYELRAGGDADRPALVVGAEPAEHSDPQRGGPQDPPCLRGDAGQQACVGRLLADRAAAARRDRRRAGAAAGVQGRARHPCHDGVRDVRRADQGHAGRRAPPRQGDQLRHHLWHLGVRAGEPACDPREEAGAYIKKYFERFPGIRAYMDDTKAFAKKNGYVLTLFGRKCHYPDIANSNPSVRAFNERAAINARLQGTAADIIRRAMIRMDEALARKNSARRCCCRCTTSWCSRYRRARSRRPCRWSRR